MQLKLYRTTIVIWSDYDPMATPINDLVRDALAGDSIIGESKVIEITSVDEVPEGVLSFLVPEALDSKDA